MSTCRSCGAEIDWAMTPTGKMIPLDLGLYDNGNIELRQGVAYVVPVAGSHGPPPRRRSHFATCPSSVEHRRRK